MSTTKGAPTGREAQRLETRQRLLVAATAEHGRKGIAGAVLNAIVGEVGVARGTFYFHFPTKEHALVDIEARQEDLIAAELGDYLATGPGLAEALAKTIELIADIEIRLGKHLFKDLVALRFSPNRPVSEQWREHKVITLVVELIESAQRRGEAEIVVDPYHSAVFFLLGVYGLLAVTIDADQLRTESADSYLTYTLRSLQAR